jgi:uncharacterized protein (TIGR02611 family)
MKAVRTVAGFTLLAFGVVMLVTPGPGWLSIGLGLTLLASEYAWARHWRDRLRDEGSRLAHRIGKG